MRTLDLARRATGAASGVLHHRGVHGRCASCRRPRTPPGWKGGVSLQRIGPRGAARRRGALACDLGRSRLRGEHPARPVRHAGFRRLGLARVNRGARGVGALAVLFTGADAELSPLHGRCSSTWRRSRAPSPGPGRTRRPTRSASPRRCPTASRSSTRTGSSAPGTPPRSSSPASRRPTPSAAVRRSTCRSRARCRSPTSRSGGGSSCARRRRTAPATAS